MIKNGLREMRAVGLVAAEKSLGLEEIGRLIVAERDRENSIEDKR